MAAEPVALPVNAPVNVVADTLPALMLPVTAKTFVDVLNVKFALPPKLSESLNWTAVLEPAGCCKSHGLPFA